MSQIMNPVGPRVPKTEFMQALDLTPSNKDHEAEYRTMKVDLNNIN